MTSQTERKPTQQGRGLLRKEHAHTGYVTNDLDRAMEIFRSRYGIAEFTFIEGPMADGGQIRVAFAWAGGQVYEIIQASGPSAAFNNEMLPEGEFAIRFHHLGFIVHDQQGWEALEAELEADQWPIAFSTLAHDFIDAYYVKAPELGHYVEYVRPFQAGIDFYAAVPAN
jgi:hypothetical protein